MYVPAAMVRGSKQGALMKDLLLGFEPVQRYIESIQARFGAVATICADLQGGALIGIKWRSAVSHCCDVWIHQQGCHLAITRADHT